MSGGPPWSPPGAQGPTRAAVPWSPPGTTIPAGDAIGGHTLLLTVVAPGGGRTSTRVPADLPIAQLAPGLGAVVNVANVSDLDDDRGGRISGTSTLAEAGMTDGSTVHVVAPGITRRPTGPDRPGAPDPSGHLRPSGPPNPPVSPSPSSPSSPSGPPSALSAPSAGPSGPPWPTGERSPAGSQGGARTATTAPDPFAVGPADANTVRTPVAVLAVVVAAVVFFVLGGVMLGGSGTPTPGPGPVGRRAAAAWLNARSFAGPSAPGVPATLDRIGTIAASSVQSAGQWHHGGDAGETFVVVPAEPGATTAQTPFAVTVVTRNGRLAFPPTVSLIPVVNGRMPPAPGGSRGTGGGPVPGTVAAWAQDQFGPKGVQPPVLQLGLAGDPTVVGRWSPEAGRTVYRLRVPLDSLAPGTAQAKQIGIDQALAAKVATDTSAVQADQAGLAQSQAQARAAQQAAATANPPNPPPLVAASIAANGVVVAAAQKLNADTAALTADRDAAAKSAGLSRGVTKTAAVATYDVWMRAQAVVGWAPAAYGVTG